MVRWVFFGTSIFALELLQGLIHRGIIPIAIVTRPDQPAHRGQRLSSSPVKEEAIRQGIPLFQPQKASDPAFVAENLIPLRADLFIVAAYGEIVKKNLLDLPRLGCMNVHASLLPAYRGAAPIQRSILEGNTETGVALMKMDEGLDTGPIWRMLQYPIPADATAGDVSSALAQLGAQGIVDLLPFLIAGEQPKAQPIDGISYAKKLTAADGELIWDAPWQEVYARFRAVTPKPGAWCTVMVRGEPRRLRIHRMAPVPTLNATPRTAVCQASLPLAIACQEGGLSLQEVQWEGRARMSIMPFLNGSQGINLIF